ncbi:M28 family peptidase [Namhaeicola litoreus]|uniref:Vacuolar membrane protease n=1 Tax=Namhaeicola litoreus TaxID=1052145 RepID=A0ABW3Y2T3_9FLAO
MQSQKSYIPTISFLLIVFFIGWSISSLSPVPKGENVPLNQFSTERALVHVKNISAKPHYVGSKAHADVRTYIVQELESLGLSVEIQDQIAINRKWRAGASTKNILAKIEGSKPGNALVLLTHYDSAPHSSLGASDAASGVATILEGLRAYLEQGNIPENDIIILISDAEELGLLGANAFIKHHPWAKEVKLAINFEARGSGGPSFMLLETNGGNKQLIKAFNEINPKKAVANSLLYSIYKLLPNDMDLTVFREEDNIQGYNMAFIDDHFDYHTELDTYERLDKNTLAHQGAYIMQLLPHFAQADITQLHSEEDLVYFNFPGLDLLNYPFTFVLPMTILGFIWLFILIFLGFKKKKLHPISIVKGFIPFLLSLIFTALLCFYGWKIILKLYPQYREILHGFTYNGYYYVTALLSLALALCLFFYRKFFLNYSVSDLVIAPIFIWLLINLLIAFYLPGAGFFILPVYLALLVLSFLLFTEEKNHIQLLFYTIFFLPVLIVFSPLIQMFPSGLGLKMTVISGVFVVLIFGLMLPVIASFKNRKEFTKLFLLIGVLALISAGFTSEWDTERKKPNSVVYIADVDTNKAYFASYDQKPDEYTSQYLSDDPISGNLFQDFSPSKYGTALSLYHETEFINFHQSEIKLIRDSVVGDFKQITFRLTPLRKINRIEILSENIMHFKEFTLNGEELKGNEDFIFTTENRPHVLSYYFSEPGEFIEISFSIPKHEKPEFLLLEASYNFFENKDLKKYTSNFSKRNNTMIPKPFVLNDAIIVKRSIQF